MVKKKKNTHEDKKKKAKASVAKNDNEGDEEEGSEAEAVPSPAQPTKRKASTVEILMKSIDYRKGGSFRREQLQLHLIVGVLKAFCRLHSEMVFGV
jgi:hypothetical protein